MSLQLETPKMVTQSGDTWSQLCLERSHTNMDTSAPAVFGCYQGTPPQTSPWLWLQLCLCPQHGHPQERRRESAGPSLKILSSQLLQDSDDCQWKQSFPGPPDYLSPWGPPHYSCSSPFISCTPRRAPGGLLPPAIPATIHNPTVVVQAGSAHHLNSGKSLPQDETSSAEGSRDIIISFSPSLSYPSELSKVMAQLSCSPFFLLLHPLLHTLGLSAGTMQSSHCCLLSLLLCLLSGTWANLEGAFTLRLLQTTTFQNTSFTDTEGLGLLEDIELGSLDKHTWSIHFCQPWVRPALPHVDWDTIENLLKVYLQKFNHLINEEAMQRDVPYPFVVQCMAGCMLYPNRTSQAFAYVGYNGQDFLSFDTENVTWTLSQDTKLSRYVQSFLQNYTALNELVEIIFNDTCVDEMEMFLHYGRAAVERQELPVATVFARTPSLDQLLLVCHVTGFYPRPISVAWLRDGQEVPPGPALNTSTILPNADLTYQLRSVLAVAPRDGHSYVCRVRHHSLGTRSLLIPWGNSEVVLITGLMAGLLAAMAIAAISVLWVWRQRKHQQMEESESRNSILSKEA
ncbi:antigen-presenting glycoprotein CD1d-like isoform 3-T3 [Acridotheres tristis]